MKLKEQEVEKVGMNKELYDLFIKLIQLEYNKASFLKGAKFYCWSRGMNNNVKFFKKIIDACSKCKSELIWHLLSRFEEIPEFKVSTIKTDYESVEAVFTAFAELEDEYVELLENVAKKAHETNDVEALAFLLPIIKEIDHIACRAMEAVKNEEDPLSLVDSRSLNC